jgi:hypothetical protein
MHQGGNWPRTAAKGGNLLADGRAAVDGADVDAEMLHEVFGLLRVTVARRNKGWGGALRGRFECKARAREQR